MQSSFITNNGIPSGFPSLDKITGGWQNGDLIVIGSRPYVGKTAFGLNVAINVAMNMHIPVMYYSLEMSTEYIAKRLLYSHANAEGNIADEKELIEVIKEISAPISEITEEIRYYQTVIDEHYQAIREMRAAKEIIAHYRAIAEHSENARVYVAHECNPNGDEE